MPIIGLMILLSTGFSFSKETGPTPNCKRARNELNETKLLTAIGDDFTKLESWSPDLITRIVLEIRGPLLCHCPDKEYANKANELEKLYLKKLLGAEPGTEESALLFRALLTLKDDFERLRARIEKEKIQVKTWKDLIKIYPTIEEYEGVVLVSDEMADLKALKGFLKELANVAHKPSFFLDKSALMKILVAGTPGIAAYVPEIAVLVVSRDLIIDLNPLHKLVLVHELAHVAERAAWNHWRVDWKEEFKSFSGWEMKDGKWRVTVARKKRAEKDKLSGFVTNSPYSYLPDDRVWGVKGKKTLDGFLFEKSYSASLERNDLSEDIADAIAAYYISPERFCLGKSEFAKKKRLWIEKNIFNLSSVNCTSSQAAP